MDSRVLYSYEFTPSEIYMAQHMKSTDVDTILNFAAAGIEEKPSLQERVGSAWDRGKRSGL